MLRLRPFRTPDAKERNTQLQEKAGLILKWKYIKNNRIATEAWFNSLDV